MPYIDTGRDQPVFRGCRRWWCYGVGTGRAWRHSESWQAVIPLLAADRHVIAVDLRCARRSEKPTGSFSLADVAGRSGCVVAGARPPEAFIIQRLRRDGQDAWCKRATGCASSEPPLPNVCFG
jgi:hypothetical protein